MTINDPHMTTTKLIILVISTILIILFSWFVSIRERRSHGIPRFFVFEGLLLLGLLQWKVWFEDPFAFRQIISWVFLIMSVYYVIASAFLYHRYALHGQNFENSTRLVTKGLYHYIRHPMYASLLFLGWGMFFKDINLVSIIIIAIVSVAVFLTCKVEEQEMIKKFGEEYKDYLHKTKMWIPRLI
jgi:protein-S-isoprenylcysteine O-methyltransferase Ste14